MDVITFLENMLNTSGLSILLHGVISLPDARRHMINLYTTHNLANGKILKNQVKHTYLKRLNCKTSFTNVTDT